MSNSISSLSINQTSANSGTGIDVTAVVNQILDSERGPENAMKTQQSQLQSEATDLKTLQSELTALQTQVNALRDPVGVLSKTAATSSRTDIISATAQSSAAAGTHLVVVNNLASTGTAYSDAVQSSSSTFSAGVISLTIGGVQHDIQVDSTNNTLSGLAKSINSQNLGVTASIVNDASGSRLALVSNAAGSAGDISIVSNRSGLAMNKGATGQNASLMIDGVPYSSASNIVTGAIAGVTLNLNSSAPNTEVLVTVGVDQASVQQAVQDFVTAYNTLIKSVNSEFSYDATTGSSGVLSTDSSIRTLQSILLSNITYSITGNNGLVNLASIGVNMNNDGTLSVDSSQLSNVINTDYSDFQNFFQTGTTGFAQNLGSTLDMLASPGDGIINVDLTQNLNMQSQLTQQINDFEDRLAARQTSLINEYSQMDTLLREYPLRMQQIQSQLASLPTYSSTSG